MDGGRIPTEVEMKIRTDAIATSNGVRYLGLRFVCKLTL